MERSDLPAMRASGDASPLLNVSQIAELAKVGVSAVSNWRKRFDDFPAPARTSPGSRDLFELRSVESWLKAHDRLDQERRSQHLLWSAADLLRSRLGASSTAETIGAALALTAICHRQGLAGIARVDTEAFLAAVQDPDVEEALEPLARLDRETANRLFRLVGEIDEAELLESFEWLLLRSDNFLEPQSSAAQVELLSALIGEPSGAVYDPVAGSGAFLAAAWAARSDGARPDLFGQEINADVSKMAKQRFLISGAPVSLAIGDTLLNDHWPDLRADVVVCDPPYGVRKRWPARMTGDPRWIAGRPPSITDFAWLQHVVHHLSDDGRGYVFLPLGSLQGGGRTREQRRELLIEGAVEAIVSLPPRSATRTQIPLALWVLRAAGRRGNRDSVLVVDAAASVRADRPALDGPLIQRIAGAVGEWRTEARVAERNRDFAAAPPVLDLLGGDASLMPGRWMRRELTAAQREKKAADFVEDVGRVLSTQEALASGIELDVPSGAVGPPAWTSVGRLAEDGLVEIVRGTRIKPDDYCPSGLPVLQPGDVFSRFGAKVEPRFVEPGSPGSPASVTRPGDVVLVSAGDTLSAAVDHDGGHLLAQPLQALRLLDGFMDPEVVAAFLEVPRNQMGRVSLREIELPVLSLAEAKALRASLDELNERERLADELRVSVRHLRRTLLSLASSAAIGERGE